MTSVLRYLIRFRLSHTLPSLFVKFDHTGLLRADRGKGRRRVSGCDGCLHCLLDACGCSMLLEGCFV
jgi:hypothetical protein